MTLGCVGDCCDETNGGASDGLGPTAFLLARRGVQIGTSDGVVRVAGTRTRQRPRSAVHLWHWTSTIGRFERVARLGDAEPSRER